MFGRQHNNDLSGGTAQGWGWPRSDRARRRERVRADAEMINELRWQWRCACQGTPLAPIVYTPSGPTRSIPQIGHVDLGPPVTFTVRIRPGQTIDDFVAAAPAIAPAFGVADLQITPLVPQWVKIVFVTYALEAVPDLPPELRLDAWRVGA